MESDYHRAPSSSGGNRSICVTWHIRLGDLACPNNIHCQREDICLTYTATDDAQQETGLMNKQVTNTTTMLFAFSAMGTYQFWIYDTNTSLVVIWISATGDTGQVVYVYADAQPCHSSISVSCPIY